MADMYYKRSPNAQERSKKRRKAQKPSWIFDPRIRDKRIDNETDKKRAGEAGWGGGNQ